MTAAGIFAASMQKFRSLSSIQAALRAGTVNCRSLVEHYLQQTEQYSHLNAYVEVWAEEALDRADRLDAKFREHPGAMGPLFGAVLSLKDNICYAGHKVTAASKILEGFVSLYSATAVGRVLAADAILIGRSNCDQFGMGSSNENSVYGPVRNALDPERVPGGSSGGGAVSVQTDTCLLALGSDTGGSVRQPAAFCGIWGFKPTYGRISRHGLIAYGSSFDQIGMMGHNPADMAALLRVMEGPDEFDSTAALTQPPADTIPHPASIACFSETIGHRGLEAGIRDVTLGFMERLRAAGHTVDEVPFDPGGGDLLDYVIPAYYVLSTAEASSNLARYDGIRYGYRSPHARNLEETYLFSRTEGFSEEVKRRILLGTFVLSSGYYDAYYNKAQQVRAILRRRMLEVFNSYDLILMPASPTAPWRFGEKSDDPVAMYLSDIYTVLANLAGLPALAIPAGKHPENSLPVGVQLMAAPGMDENLLAFGDGL